MRTQPRSLTIVASLVMVSLLSLSTRAETLNSNTSNAQFPPPAQLRVHLTADYEFRFNWDPVDEATLYHLQLKRSDSDRFIDLVANLPADLTHYRLVPALLERSTRQYRLLSCNALGCSPSNTLTVRSNAATDLTQWLPRQRSNLFGTALSFNEDGTVLAVGAPTAKLHNIKTGLGSGAVYLFQHEQGRWYAPTTLAASALSASVERFGYSVTLDADGRALAVGSQVRNSESSGGALHLYARQGQNDWRSTLDAPPGWRPNTRLPPLPVSFSQDGNTLALSSHYELVQYRSGGIDDNPLPEVDHVRAISMIERSVQGPQWLTPPLADPDAWFGYAISLSGDGRVLAVGAPRLTSGIDDAEQGGDVYLYQREPSGRWRFHSRLQPSVRQTSELFGYAVSLNGDGSVLAISAFGQPDNQTSSPAAGDSLGQGVVHVFTRTASTGWRFNTLLTAPVGNWETLAQVQAAQQH